jgi:hypothetical protein
LEVADEVLLTSVPPPDTTLAVSPERPLPQGENRLVVHVSDVVGNRAEA